MSSILKLFLIILFAFSIAGCFKTSEKDVTVYLLQEDVPDPKKSSKITITPLHPRTFIAWRNTNAVVSSGPLGGYVNKMCTVEDKNNWYCYRKKEDALFNKTRMHDNNTYTHVYIANNGECSPVVEYAILNGKWVDQYIEKEDGTSFSKIYSVPYWKWFLYEYKFLKNIQL